MLTETGKLSILILRNKMIKWNSYYERSPFMEGVSSTFDLFGRNSSFRKPWERYQSLGETNYIKQTMGMHFGEIYKYLMGAINQYGEIQKNRKF